MSHDLLVQMAYYTSIYNFEAPFTLQKKMGPDP